ncbi:MAG: bifunctional 4-hydroxy-2-oxoglutarate aldolase/2-dehydro-3-deoxy-phosphogluconate aldolase [Acidobacteria bacterium]|nr:bifunctional 4-hydroxy-2-oxoglutarate aldolase/2-dehydro-3-deoxy-phosphogluconate aldolase [Acidobacteriota bacterium]
MMDINQTVNQLVRDGFILVFNQDRLDVVKTAQALAEAGVGNMEVTCRIQKPLEKIHQLRQAMPDFCIGAASLIDFPPMLKRYNGRNPHDPLPSVDEVVDAGVDYLVSALNFSEAAYEKYSGRIAMVPGCGSATEIVRQYANGANLCKLFPAKQLGGSSYIKALDPAIHKLISIVPTGGTDAGNIPDYIKAGVLILGGSFSMISGESLNIIIEEQDYALLSSEVKKVKILIDDCRAGQYPGMDFQTASLEQISKITGRCFNID